jgi:hypothetical protein
MVNYQNGKIYKMVSNKAGDDKIYIGSTCATLRLRKSNHKKKMKIYPNRDVYKHFIEMGWENVSLILLEEYKCNNKLELEMRERKWIEELKPVLNYITPTRTKKEYYIDNKEMLAEKSKKYYLENKVRLIANGKIKIECACGGKYTKNNPGQHFKSKKHMDYLIR